MFTGKSDVIFSGPKFSCALRNTRKSFRELYGTVFGPETFSGLLRNARLTRMIPGSRYWRFSSQCFVEAYLVCQKPISLPLTRSFPLSSSLSRISNVSELNAESISELGVASWMCLSSPYIISVGFFVNNGFSCVINLSLKNRAQRPYWETIGSWSLSRGPCCVRSVLSRSLGLIFFSCILPVRPSPSWLIRCTFYLTLQQLKFPLSFHFGCSRPPHKLLNENHIFECLDKV